MRSHNSCVQTLVTQGELRKYPFASPQDESVLLPSHHSYDRHCHKQRHTHCTNSTRICSTLLHGHWIQIIFLDACTVVLYSSCNKLCPVCGLIWDKMDYRKGILLDFFKLSTPQTHNLESPITLLFGCITWSQKAVMMQTMSSCFVWR